MADPLPPTSTNEPPPDPVFVAARREALVILGAWATCLVWCITTCVVLGYGDSSGDVTLILGIPHWVFWGVVVPWASAGVFSVVFATFFMKDHDLGPDRMIEDAERTTRDNADSAEGDDA